MTPAQIEARLNELASTDANRPEVKLRSAFSLSALYRLATVPGTAVGLQPAMGSALAYAIQAIAGLGTVCSLGAFISDIVVVSRERRCQLDW